MPLLRSADGDNYFDNGEDDDGGDDGGGGGDGTSFSGRPLSGLRLITYNCAFIDRLQTEGRSTKRTRG